MVDYIEFVEFHEKHPDLDNQEYYAEFPETNKSTIRSWKLKVRKVQEPASPSQPDPPTIPSISTEGYEEQQKEYIKLLMTQTGSKETEFEGVDALSKIMVLKNRLKAQQGQPPSRTPNSSILPNPKPIGQSTATFGIDEYIAFDPNLNEIRMEIPMSKLMNPKENEKIREIS